jgi:hypothetical protein
MKYFLSLIVLKLLFFKVVPDLVGNNKEKIKKKEQKYQKIGCT